MIRSFEEPSGANFLREPLFWGVPLMSLIPLIGTGAILEVVVPSTKYSDMVILGTGLVIYIALRCITRWCRKGWDEYLLFRGGQAWGWFKEVINTKVQAEHDHKAVATAPSSHAVVAHETLSEVDLIRVKLELMERLRQLKASERITLATTTSKEGCRLTEFNGVVRTRPLLSDIQAATTQEWAHDAFIYSLYSLPVRSSPLWLFGIMRELPEGVTIIASFKGIEQHKIKSTIEKTRTRNAQYGQVSSVDSSVSFDEASEVLTAMSRGDERIIEGALVIISPERLELDPLQFCLEKNRLFPLASILGLRSRLHRRHYLKLSTASDLIPNVFDPREEGTAILETTLGNKLYYSPLDPSLDNKHIIVVGPARSGKSLATGLMLLRLIDDGQPISVLFIDYLWTFRRVVRKRKGVHVVPNELGDIGPQLARAFAAINKPGQIAAIELSDLGMKSRAAAFEAMFPVIDEYVRKRTTAHLIYIVIDEMHNYLENNADAIDSFFRLYGRMRIGTVGITHSLTDLLKHPLGVAIVQNSGTKILFRQEEDLAPYKGTIGVDAEVLARLRLLQKKTGVFSECFIKTPKGSRIGRVCPTHEEHEDLRSDNIMDELSEEHLAKVMDELPEENDGSPLNRLKASLHPRVLTDVTTRAADATAARVELQISNASTKMTEGGAPCDLH